MIKSFKKPSQAIAYLDSRPDLKKSECGKFWIREKNDVDCFAYLSVKKFEDGHGFVIRYFTPLERFGNLAERYIFDEPVRFSTKNIDGEDYLYFETKDAAIKFIKSLPELHYKNSIIKFDVPKTMAGSFIQYFPPAEKNYGDNHIIHSFTRPVSAEKDFERNAWYFKIDKYDCEKLKAKDLMLVTPEIYSFPFETENGIKQKLIVDTTCER